MDYDDWMEWGRAFRYDKRISRGHFIILGSVCITKKGKLMPGRRMSERCERSDWIGKLSLSSLWGDRTYFRLYAAFCTTPCHVALDIFCLISQGYKPGYGALSITCEADRYHTPCLQAGISSYSWTPKLEPRWCLRPPHRWWQNPWAVHRSYTEDEFW